MQERPARARVRPPLIPMLLAIVAVLAGTGAYAAWLSIPARPEFDGTAYEPAPAAGFRLRGLDGRAVSLADYRGRPLLLFFGYTRCTDFCPLTLDRMARAIRELGDDAGGARIVMVTVDPAHDTPDVLRRYTARFGPQVTALTGDSASLATAWGGYSVYVAAGARAVAEGNAHGHAGHGPGGVPALAHSGVVYGIDRHGDLRVVITEGAREESIRHDIRALARF